MHYSMNTQIHKCKLQGQEGVCIIMNDFGWWPHVCGAGESLVKAQKSHSVNNGQVTY